MREIMFYKFITCMCLILVSLSMPILADGLPPLSGDDVALLDSTVMVQDKLAGEVWPGFVGFRPAVLLFTDSGQYLMNAATAPAYYQRYAGPAPVWAKNNWWTGERKNVFGQPFSDEESNGAEINSAYSSEQSDKHFPYSVFLIDSLARYHKKGIDWTVEDWMTIYWHEVFHTYQDGLYAPALVTSERTDMGPIRDLISSSTYRNSILEEQRLMQRALLAKKPAEKRLWACDRLLSKRHQRYARLIAQGRGDAVRNEQFYEVSEGTARYVEEMLTAFAAALKSEEWEPLDGQMSLGKNYNRFAKFKNRTKVSYYGRITNIPEGARYFYATGFSLALFLDQVDPGWKADVFRTDGFLNTKLESFCVAFEQR